MSKVIELPRYCYAEHPVTEELIQIVKGTSGYFPITDERKNKSTYELNEEIGVYDVRIIEAMMCGSMFGWDVPGADPNSYDENLNLIEG
ncbi:hypothetical protein [Bacillus sp. FJAT-22090]|uniref:hypothetical protein n=1 Tax=Bacillus sp. FJAT-22090 TaxID=1581038 RepID=UPI0011A7DCA8|nr:hypothetical protein [Bacillus sp. FJAT-22090]